MNKSEFISLIENPETPGKSHISALKHIAADFPYFQCAQTLLTKALYNEHHYEFEKHLKHTSIMVPDRAVLFRYIHNLKDVADVYRQKPVEQFTQPTALPDPVKEVLEDIVIPPPADTEPEIIEQEELIQIPEPVEEPAPDVVEAIEDIIETAAEAEPETTIEELPEYAYLEEQPEPLDQETETIFPETGELLPETEEPEPEPETVAEIVEPLQEESPGKEPADEISVSGNEVHSFTEWLKLQQGHKIVVEVQPETVETPEPSMEPVAEAAEEITQDAIAPEVIETPIVEAETEEEKNRKSNIDQFESILDKFIRDNPRISRPKAEFYNPVNMAKQSVESDDEMVTETLANVYYKQGHYKKAIRAYEKLCLIYPHKMTYFASLIQKIKNENKE